MNYFLSLGSNLGDREKNLREACCLLENRSVKILKSSSIYETQPVDYLPQSWFLNLALEVQTRLLPEELMEVINEIETKLGRIKSIPKGPRKIDIDIVLAGESIHQTSRLDIPHPRMHKRNFVLVPLSEIASGAVHPVLKKTIEFLVLDNGDPSEIRKYRQGVG